eukprot:s595_g14.t1
MASTTLFTMMMMMTMTMTMTSGGGHGDVDIDADNAVDADGDADEMVVMKTVGFPQERCQSEHRMTTRKTRHLPTPVLKHGCPGVGKRD